MENVIISNLLSIGGCEVYSMPKNGFFARFDNEENATKAYEHLVNIRLVPMYGKPPFSVKKTTTLNTGDKEAVISYGDGVTITFTLSGLDISVNIKRANDPTAQPKNRFTRFVGWLANVFFGSK